MTSSAFLSAQSTAEEIETLLSAKSVTYAQAARFVLEASEAMVTSDLEKAFQYAEEQGWLPKKASQNEEARMDGIALLFMGAFKLKGGIFYSLLKSPHYAYREMEYRNLIQGRKDPAMNVSGENLLFIAGKILSDQENGQDGRQ